MTTEAAQTAHPKVVVKKTIRAKQERVFDAWTKAEIMEKWFYCIELR